MPEPVGDDFARGCGWGILLGILFWAVLGAVVWAWLHRSALA